MNYFVTLAFVLWVYMTLWFIVSLIKKRADVADMAWGLGFPLLAWVLSYALTRHDMVGIQKTALIVNMFVTIWGVRLAIHIFARNYGKAEDYRYAQWRQKWGKWFVLRSYAQVFLLQGIFLFLIAQPVIAINLHNASTFGLLEVAGIAVWIVGFWFEMTADRQLTRFVRDVHATGKIMQTGLWKYSRHPNYFGEITQWWGIWLIACGVPGGFVTVVGPLTITILIVYVSGIPMLEKKMAEKPGFAEYKSKTSALVPWWPTA